MSYVFHFHEIAAIARVTALLLSPLAFPQLDAWRQEVNARIHELLAADSASGCTRPSWNEEQGTSTSTAKDGDPFRYLQGENEDGYAILDATSADGRHGWRDPEGRALDSRSVAILSMLAPAIRSGVEAARQHFQFTSRFMRALDQHEVPVLLIGTDGVVAHRSQALESMIGRDPAPPLLNEAIDRFGRDAHGARGERSASRREHNVSTPLGRYVLRATHAAHAGGHATVITVEPPRLRAYTDDELRETFALTATEVRVAHALAEGGSNAEIAERFAVSVHTVRRHVENVFRKLGVNARAAVAARLVRGSAR